MKHKKIFYILFTVVLICVTLAAIDYARIKGNEKPLFMIEIGKNRGKRIHYYGLGYKLERTVKNSAAEILSMDEEVRFGFLFYTWKIKINTSKPSVKTKRNYDYTVYTKVQNHCTKNVQLYAQDETRKYYTVCLEEINYLTDDQTYTLKEAMDEKKFTLGSLVKNMDEYSIYKDGGSRMYKDDGTTGFTNQGLSVLVCKTLEGIEDYYIGSKSMQYEEDFCKLRSEQICTFTKTYRLLHKTEATDGNFYLNLEKFQGEVDTVLVSQEIAQSLEENKTYEFTFQKTGEDIPDQIKDIFESATLKNVENTVKVGVEQIQEVKCQKVS